MVDVSQPQPLGLQMCQPAFVELVGALGGPDVEDVEDALNVALRVCLADEDPEWVEVLAGVAAAVLVTTWAGFAPMPGFADRLWPPAGHPQRRIRELAGEVLERLMSSATEAWAKLWVSVEATNQAPVVLQMVEALRLGEGPRLPPADPQARQPNGCQS